MASRHHAGQCAEGWALTHLEEHGLHLVARNWRCRYGEIDLIMNEGDTLVFVEVRYRAYTQWGGAENSIDTRKRQRLITAAQLFLQKNPPCAHQPCRFDCVAIQACTPRAAPQLNWIRNAFDS